MMRRENHVKEGFKKLRELILWGAAAENHVKEGFKELKELILWGAAAENHVKGGFKELILWGAAAYLLAGITWEAVRGILWTGHLIA